MICKACRQDKPSTEFYRNKYRFPGYFAVCKVCDGIRAKLRNEALRVEVIERYGGKCACCGETEPCFLGMDHIGGKSDRYDTGANLYKRLKRENFPKEGYRVLCHNCNLAIGFYGKCPHEK
jgi:hypothetical protein